ncbi:cytochrome-c oxidase, cbb3-type subunit III [Acidihalobacter yilgarnensis]|uniref:Cbb3-type cytochrome c oxidase subunit n=1 Tax=Acidihalobacter yilgarnensis TaxID=2819280 RepID=A0A1D8IK63_9GAMM|nr:cytochrome-c oxidase, cbb3-type subunit III [Acidihalobacter yilgarnensis]AOU96781.1 cytochrome-c oxidase, cbb3-type subunit III [Acidihalobacter yilgarnensis]
MNDPKGKGDDTEVETTGHVWDGDLQELNNPLPGWWVWAFYGSVIFAVVYWFLYPAWPIGKTFTKGFETVTYTQADGKQKTVPWSTRAEFVHDMQSGPEALKQKAWLDKASQASMRQLETDPQLLDFTMKIGKRLFGDNCAACHGAGGQGVLGHYPNLTDDAWLWGGSLNTIRQTIAQGRHGFMPAFKGSFSQTEVVDLAEFVLSLSGTPGGNAAAIQRGAQIFRSDQSGCFYCHTKAGTGNRVVGSANLADKVWTIANVPGATTYTAKIAAVSAVINKGVQRQMPAWDHRLSQTEIKLLAVYVHALGVASSDA